MPTVSAVRMAATLLPTMALLLYMPLTKFLELFPDFPARPSRGM